MHAAPRRSAPRAGVVALALALLLGAVAAFSLPRPSASAAGGEDLYLVTLDGPGTAGSRSALPLELRRIRLLAEQDRTLAAVGAPGPTYRWTTALTGYAVRLDSEQAQALEAVPGVVSVERNEVLPLAGLRAPAAAATLAGRRLDLDRPAAGGAGTVVGVIDTGLAPESPLFAQVRHRRGAPSFAGECTPGQGWTGAECGGKVAGARWFVDGFGTERLSATSVLSPRDTDGHGTQMATIAAGNADVPVEIGGERLGRLGGLAPDARLAVYKACWGAPDPADDGCATADLVSAVDAATRDGVDVLSLSVGGGAEIDTVERALLGATESGIVVTAAAGNGGRDTLAAHAGPWVTTVGGVSGDLRRGRVVVPRSAPGRAPRELTGAMLSGRTVGPAPVVLGASVAADTARPGDARVCSPGSLDAARAGGSIVVCERGRVGRTDKSRAVALADGVGMVLVNRRRGSVDLDVHSVPTVHLDEAAGSRLIRWLRGRPDARVTLRSLGQVPRPVRVAALSASGALGGTLKPDVVAPATGVLGVVPATSPSTSSAASADGASADAWAFTTGTSAATAYVAGLAATLLARDDWTPERVRSALATTATPVRGASPLRSGSGAVRPSRVDAPGLAYLVAPGDYRAWLDGDDIELNIASALLGEGQTTFTRTVTNTTGSRLYFSSSARGFRSDVTVVPAALRLGVGESATYTVTIDRRGTRLDDGYVVWRGARGTVTRLPVVLSDRG